MKRQICLHFKMYYPKSASIPLILIVFLTIWHRIFVCLFMVGHHHLEHQLLNGKHFVWFIAILLVPATVPVYIVCSQCMFVE